MKAFCIIETNAKRQSVYPDPSPVRLFLFLVANISFHVWSWIILVTSLSLSHFNHYIRSLGRFFQIPPEPIQEILKTKNCTVCSHQLIIYLHLKYLLRGISSKDFCLTKQFMTNDQQTVSRIISKFPHRFNERNESKIKFCFVAHDRLYLETNSQDSGYSKWRHQSIREMKY